MAAVDDIYNEITRNSRTRKGRSFFPAANAINSTPQGQVIIPAGGSSAGSVLPPDQNPAYQAAIAKGRQDMGKYSWITTPSGGQMRVPTAYAWRPKSGTALEGSFVNPDTGPLTQDQYASNWQKGYGAPAPSFNPATGTVANKGVETPVEQLTLQQRSVLPRANPFMEQWGANLAAQHPRLAAFGTLAAKALSGLRGGFDNPATIQYANDASNGQLPSQPAIVQQSRHFYDYNPSPVPMRRYSDFGYY